MPDSWVRLYCELNDFVPRGQRQRPIPCRREVSSSVREIIEGLGVPHTEVDLILANGHSVGFDYLAQHEDRISVYPHFRTLDVSGLSRVRPKPLADLCFVADGHLGRLAGYLRMLGLDTLYRNDHTDEALARISSEQGRILLTRDQQLLMRRGVRHGYWVRATRPREQLLEIARRYKIGASIRPFTRCLRCNAPLEPVDKAAIAHLLEPTTRRCHDAFTRCPVCARVYWRGSHHVRMQALIEQLQRQLEAGWEGRQC